MHLFRGCETMIEIQLLIHTRWSILPTPKTDGFLLNYHDTLCVRYHRLEEPPCLHRGLLWILREGHPFRPWCPHFHPKGTMRLISTQSQTAPSFLVHLQTKTPQFWSFQNSGTMRSGQQKKGHLPLLRLSRILPNLASWQSVTIFVKWATLWAKQRRSRSRCTESHKNLTVVKPFKTAFNRFELLFNCLTFKLNIWWLDDILFESSSWDSPISTDLASHQDSTQPTQKTVKTHTISSKGWSPQSCEANFLFAVFCWTTKSYKII